MEEEAEDEYEDEEYEDEEYEQDEDHNMTGAFGKGKARFINKTSSKVDES